MNAATRTILASSIALSVLLTGCETASSSAVGAPRLEKSKVTEIIVRYQTGAPPLTDDGDPWGSQCVTIAYRYDLRRGRDIGGRMRVVHIEPAVSPVVARAIALQMAQCPYVEWAEAHVLQLQVP